jgi:hypothetical protein
MAAVVLTGAGVALLAATVFPSRGSARRAWLGEVAETAALLALLPVLVIASGLFSAIRA